MKRTPRALVYVFIGSVPMVSGTRSAWAQGYSLRSGASINPDQFSIGGQYEVGPVNDRLWLQPNADLGFGNDATLVALNFDVVFRKSVDRRSIWTAFAGGGPAVNWYKLPGYSQTEAGANVVGGLMHSRGMFTEVRVGSSKVLSCDLVWATRLAGIAA